MKEIKSLPEEIIASIRTALNEDVGSGDATSESIIPAEAVMRGQILAKQTGVIAGLDVAQEGPHRLRSQEEGGRSCLRHRRL